MWRYQKGKWQVAIFHPGWYFTKGGWTVSPINVTLGKHQGYYLLSLGLLSFGVSIRYQFGGE